MSPRLRLWLTSAAAMTRSAIVLVPALSMAVCTAQTNRTNTLEAGPLQLDVRISETANLFHVVDQISQWSEFSHRQYVRYFERLNGGLSEADRKILGEHAAIRRKYGWGKGPEETFYTALAFEEALKEGVRKGFLTAEEAQNERRVLIHFQARVHALMSESLPILEEFARQLANRRASELAAFATDMGRFVGSAPSRRIPMYLIANPDDTSIGGGYNNGMLTLEIPKARDAYPTLLHELVHAFVETKWATIENAIKSVPGLNYQTLNEGLAYAVSPGIYRAGDSDQLRAQVAGYIARRSSLSDSYTRFNFYALALRPLLEKALADPQQTLEAFLPKAVDAWLVLAELDRARGQ